MHKKLFRDRQIFGRIRQFSQTHRERREHGTATDSWNRYLGAGRTLVSKYSVPDNGVTATMELLISKVAALLKIVCKVNLNLETLASLRQTIRMYEESLPLKHF